MMRQPIYILLVLLLVVACKEKSSNNADNKKPDIASSAIPLNKTNSDVVENATKRVSFNDISEIIAESSLSIWVEKQDSIFSLALHFQYKDTLAVSYSPECWLMFPYKLDGEKIIVYWDDNVDTKYDFDIVKAMKKVDKKYLGKAFMTLELENDTTLRSTYLLKDLVRKINAPSKERTFFPAKFNLVQDGEWQL
jgi:hypothetical protein